MNSRCNVRGQRRTKNHIFMGRKTEKYLHKKREKKERKSQKFCSKSENISNIREWRCFPQMERRARVMSEFSFVSDFSAETEIGRHLFVPHFSGSYLDHIFVSVYSICLIPIIFFHSFALYTFISSYFWCVAHSLLAQNICSICYLSFI